MGNAANSRYQRGTLELVTKVKPHELGAVVVSFLYIFSLMSGYYVLRPIRDAMAREYSDFGLSVLFTMTFVFSVMLIPIYGYVCSRIRLSVLLPWVYAFFALNILAFHFAFRFMPESWIADSVFYVWLSVFNLFVVSVFWSFMADIFDKEQSKRLFGFIAAGASLGAIAGPSITLLLVERISAMNLMLISATLTALPIFFIRILIGMTRKNQALGQASGTSNLAQSMGGNPLAGITLFFRSKYLFGIGGFVVLYTFMSTLVYFQLNDLMADLDENSAIKIWARIDWAVNILALLTQAFGTARLATRFGLVVTLALVPTFMIGGLIAVSMVPILSVLIGLQILRRAGNYAITKPARDMLFTIVDPESKYKVKNVIDTTVYRGGDASSAWVITGLGQLLNLGFAGLALVGAGLAALWAYTAIYLGRQYESHDKLDAATEAQSAAVTKPASA